MTNEAQPNPSPTGTTPAATTPPVEGGQIAAPAVATSPATDGAASAAPESYQAFTLPETVTFEPATLTAVTEFAKGANFTQEQAQKLVDLGVGFADNLQKQLEGTIEKEVKAQREAWLTQAKADPEIGGAKYDESVKVAQEAIARCRPELKQLLDTFGIGNHPAVIQAFSFFGSKIRPDSFGPTGQGDVTKPATLEERASKWFDNPTSKAKVA
jgi:hypothetical protein